MTDETEDLDQEPQAEAGEAVPGIEESDADIVSMVKKSRKESEKHLADWLTEARDCYAIVAGDQWTTEDKAAVEEMGRVPIVFNRVAPVIDSVCGSEVSNRQQVQYIPRQAGDSGVNEVLTGAAKWVRDNCDAEDEESDAFFDAVVCGLGWTETRLDYVDDPEGQVIIDRKDPLTVRYDPKSKKRNLVDKKWVQCDAWLTKEEIEEKWPDAELGAPGVQEMSSSTETKPHDATNAWLYRENSSGYDSEQGKYLVVHHQWYTLQTYYKALDPMTGEIVELDADRMEAINEMTLEKGGPMIESVKLQRKVFKQAFVCGSMVLEKSLLPVQSDFTLNAITGKRDRNNNTWYGLVRPMADPQRWANKFFSQILHIINSNAKGGLVAEEDAVDNPRKLEEDWSKADSVVIVNPGAISGNKIMPKPAPAYPMAPEKMMEFSIASIRDTTGVNLELMGLADRQQAGYLEAQRKQSGMVILANFFDSLRRYRKNQGRVLAEFIREYISDGRLIRILGGDGTEKYVPLMRDQGSMKFDVVVDESPTSHNNKEKVFGLFMNLIPAMQKMGLPPPPPEFVDYMPIPASFAEKWKQSMVQASQDPAKQQQMQMQMRGAMLEQGKAEAEIHETHATAALKEAQTVGEQIENGLKQVQATVNPLGMPMNPLPMQ
jgi:hypothetical protein